MKNAGRAFEVLSLFACVWAARDLAETWTISSTDQLAWLAFLSMLVAWLQTLVRQRRGGRTLSASRVLLAGGVVLAVAGTLTTFRVLEHVGLACALASWFPDRRSRAVWLVTSLSWMPVLSWFCVPVIGSATPIVRIVVAAAGGQIAVLISQSERTGQSSRRFGPALLAALAGICVLWDLTPANGGRQTELPVLPLEGPDFIGMKLPLTETEQSKFASVELLKYGYAFDQTCVVLKVLDGTNDRHTVHDPSFCHVGSGWQPFESRSLTLDGGAGKIVRFRNGDQKRECLYWFTNGNQKHASMSWYWWQTTLRRISLGHLGSSPLLITFQHAGDEDVDWKRIAGQLAQNL